MLVSVVIPSYNHSDYVAQAIESVLDQNWPNIDLIVIDDGSTDGSPDVIREVHKRRGGFRYVFRENKGLINTLSEGLNLSRGEYFCELASDDYFPPDSVKKRIEFLQKNLNFVAVFGDGFLIEERNLRSSCFLKNKHRRLFNQSDQILEMLSGTFPVFSTGLIRRQALLEVGGFDSENFRYYEDLDTPIRLASLGRLGFIDAPVIFRRDHATNVSKTTPHIRLEKVIFYRKLYQDNTFKPYRKIIKKQLTREYLKFGRYLAHADGNLSKEKILFRNSIFFAHLDPRILWYWLRNQVPHR